MDEIRSIGPINKKFQGSGNGLRQTLLSKQAAEKNSTTPLKYCFYVESNVMHLISTLTFVSILFNRLKYLS